MPCPCCARATAAQVAAQGPASFLPRRPARCRRRPPPTRSWTSDRPGDWAELEFDSRRYKTAEDAAAGEAAERAAARAAEAGAEEMVLTAGEPTDEGDYEDAGEATRGKGRASDDDGFGGVRAAAPEEEEGGDGDSGDSADGDGDGELSVASQQAEVLLSHLKSYEGMGTAQVKCVSGCRCLTTTLDGTWGQKATLLQIHKFRVRLLGCWEGDREHSNAWRVTGAQLPAVPCSAKRMRCFESRRCAVG